MSLLIYEYSLNNSFDTDWVRFLKYDYKLKTVKKAKNLQIIWRDVVFANVPNPIGQINIHYTNFKLLDTKLGNITIDTVENISQPTVYNLETGFNYFKVAFDKLDIISGIITIAIGYKI